MVIPAVMLVILALVVMRALMTVVAHDDSAVPEHSITSSPPSPAHLDGTVRAGGSPAWLLMPAAEPEIVPEAESTADRARTSSS